MQQHAYNVPANAASAVQDRIFAWMHFRIVCVCVCVDESMCVCKQILPSFLQSPLINCRFDPTLLSAWIEISPPPTLSGAHLKVETHLSAFDLIKQPGAEMKAGTSHYLTPLATGAAWRITPHPSQTLSQLSYPFCSRSSFQEIWSCFFYLTFYCFSAYNSLLPFTSPPLPSFHFLGKLFHPCWFIVFRAFNSSS